MSNTKGKFVNEIELPILAPPTISITLKTLLDSWPTFVELGSRRFDSDARLNMRLAKMMRAAQQEINDYNTARDDLLARLGQSVADLPGQFILGANQADFNRQVKEMQSEMVTLPGSRFALEKFDALNLSIGALSLVDWLIDDSE